MASRARVRPIFKTCRQCGQPFTISVDEQAALASIAQHQGWTVVNLPGRCYACRQARRAAFLVMTPGTDTATLQCWTCGGPFAFRPHDQVYFAARGWPPPKRCVDCRRATAAAGGGPCDSTTTSG